jgi:hypothetical protein
MTAFFQYDQLTWPEIEALPRHTPLILPLGSGYSLDRLVDGFNHPEQRLAARFSIWLRQRSASL